MKTESLTKRFRTRAFVSFGLLWSFLASAFAGVVLFFRPEGSLAAWAGWSVLGLDKKGWEGFHILATAAMVVFGIWHVVLNAKALFGYLRRKAREGLRTPLEFWASIFLIALFLAGAAGRWKPLWKLMGVRASIKQGSLAVRVPPPVPDAADRSLSDLCGGSPVALKEAIGRLKKAGYPAAGPDATLTRLSGKYGVSPERLYRIITGR